MFERWKTSLQKDVLFLSLFVIQQYVLSIFSTCGVAVMMF